MNASRKQMEKDFSMIPYVKAAVAYGSKVRGDSFSTLSDIDIAIFFDGHYMTRSEYENMMVTRMKYDITPHSTAEASCLVSDFYNLGFYQHFMNNNLVIFDDFGVMEKLKKRAQQNLAARERLGYRSEHISNISYYLLRLRRGCIKLGEWLPEYGLIKPIVSDLNKFKSSLNGVMREALLLKGVQLGKDDFKEVVREKFAKEYPGFENDSMEFDMRSPEFTKGSDTAPPYIAAMMVLDGNIWHDLHRTSHKDILHQANEARRLVEFTVGCVNDEIEKRL